MMRLTSPSISCAVNSLYTLARLTSRPRKTYSVIIAVLDHAQPVAHAPLRHHRPRHVRRLAEMSPDAPLEISPETISSAMRPAIITQSFSILFGGG